MFIIVVETNRYLKKIILIKFCYVPAACAATSKGIFVAATLLTTQTRQAVCAISQSIFLRCLCRIQRGFTFEIIAFFCQIHSKVEHSRIHFLSPRKMECTHRIRVQVSTFSLSLNLNQTEYKSDMKE